MGINRPTKLNTRNYPGNGSVVGPPTSPSCVQSTTTCKSYHSSVGACGNYPLGTQYLNFYRTPCCTRVCGCNCTVVDRTVPSGMWKSSEQYEAKERDAWGGDTSSSSPRTYLCAINCGFTGSCSCSAPAGGWVICRASRVAWVVAPSSTEVERSWYARNHAITTAQAYAACGDWFIPTIDQLKNPGYICRTYWDTSSGSAFWSSIESNNTGAQRVNFYNGTNNFAGKSNLNRVRAFRCVSY